MITSNMSILTCIFSCGQYAADLAVAAKVVACLELIKEI